MLFNIESDMGGKLVGYVVPDGVATRPKLAVRANGQTLLTFEANEQRDALVAAGRHSTGQCGFSVDADMVPGLADLADLEIVETESETLVYRRPSPDRIARRVLRLETHLFPLWRLDNGLKPRFQYAASAIDQMGRETTTQLFLLDHVDSVYLSGRILYKNYAYYADTTFATVLILHEPYEELAERLLVLRNIEKVGARTLGMREAMSLKPVIEFAADLPLDDGKALGRSLRRMPPEATDFLANPLVRQLTTSTPNERPGNGAVASALDLLASCSIVGLRRDPRTFATALAELLGMDPSLLPDIVTIPSVVALGDTLRQTREAEALLGKDVELYGYVAAAFKKVA